MDVLRTCHTIEEFASNEIDEPARLALVIAVETHAPRRWTGFWQLTF